MSEEENSYTSVLLPTAKVTLFTNDEATGEAFEALSQDWRFARVELATMKGDVEAAISYYKSTTSPDLVIVQTETIDAGFSDRLEDLAGCCAEGTSAIVIGPDNDVNLYRKLIGMGVSDYLVKPVKTRQLGDDIAATLLEKIGASDSRLIALLGAKGGAGVTVLAEGLACTVAERAGQKTFLLDAAGGWSTLNVGLDFEPTTTLAEAVRAATEQNEDSLTRMLTTVQEKLTVLSSGGDVMLDDPVLPESYEVLLDHLMTTYPVIIVDLSGASAGLKRTVIRKAHEVILVATPALPAVRAARTLFQEVRQLRGDSDEGVKIVVNMHGIAPKTEVPKAQIEEGLETKDITYIPFTPGLFIGLENEGRKLTNDKDGGPVIDKLAQLVAGLIPTGAAVSTEEKKDGLGNLLNKLKARS